VLIKNYGVPKEEAVENVKDVFEQVGIHEMHHKAANDIFESIQKKLKFVSHRLVQKGIMSLLAAMMAKYK